MGVRSGYKQTEVGVIPEDWDVASIGTIASFKSGDGINVAALCEQSSDTPIPVYGGNGIAGYTDRALVQHRVVVVGRVGQKCGEVYLTDGPSWITDNALYPRTFFRKIDMRLLALALKGVGLNDVKNRNDLPLITQSILHLVRIPLPPTRAEQETIAEALSDADALIESLEQLLVKKRHLKQGAMQELLTGKKRLPGFSEKWEVKRLGNTAILKARIGWQGLTTAEYLDSGDYYLVTGTEFKDGYIDWNNCHYVTESRYKQDKYIQLKEHDVLVTKDGTIGKVALIASLPKPATLNSGVFVIRPVEDAFHPEFF